MFLRANAPPDFFSPLILFASMLLDYENDSSPLFMGFDHRSFETDFTNPLNYVPCTSTRTYDFGFSSNHIDFLEDTVDTFDPYPQLLDTAFQSRLSTNTDSKIHSISPMNHEATAAEVIQGDRSKRRRAILTAEKASEIFILKRFGLMQTYSPNLASSSDSVAVSRLYGISPKAVRDVWNG